MKHRKIIEESLKKLVNNDLDLIRRELKEECINHCFAKYIEQEIRKFHPANRYSVDLEYDKNYENPKQMTYSDGKIYSIRPDIIVHKRERNDSNEIYIECKKPYLTKDDKEKLLQAKKNPFLYKFSIGICYLPRKKYMRLYIANENGSFTIYKFDKKKETIQQI